MSLSSIIKEISDLIFPENKEEEEKEEKKKEESDLQGRGGTGDTSVY